MPQLCTVCSHELSHEINVALVNNTGNRRIASQYGLSEAAVRRHRADHIPGLLLKAYEAIERDDAEDLASELARVKEDVHRLKAKAEDEGDIRAALLGCDKAIKALELQAKIEQLIQTQPTLNLTLNPEYIEMRTAILVALEPHPEAAESVSRAMLELEDNGRHR